MNTYRLHVTFQKSNVIGETQKYGGFTVQANSAAEALKIITQRFEHSRTPVVERFTTVWQA